MNVLFVGPGRVATAIALCCQRANIQVVAGVMPKGRTHSEQSAQFTSLTQVGVLPWEEARGALLQADVVCVTVPDRAIQQVAGNLVEAGYVRNGHIVLHTSGALASDELAAVSACHAYAASFHPLHAFASPHEAAQLAKGITVALEGDDEAVRVGKELALRLEMKPTVIPKEAKAAYHAAAVLSSNAVVTLLFAASRLVQLDTGVDAFLPLVRGAIEQVEQVGVPNALTGPIERGDVVTVKRHLEALRDTPMIEEMYRSIGVVTVQMALAKGSIIEDTARKLDNVLRTRKG